ncbi:DegT/DnrJ/EryC1/StrS family aminotransferase [bacterium]|nr:DegT/DnrJ/EryC1/StrS family aminotransferase [bacterium]
MRRITVGDFKITEKEKKRVLEVLGTNRISEGKFVREFEDKFAEYIGVKDAVLVNSGTSALIAAMTAISYNKDKNNKAKKVITTPLSFIATVNAIVLSGFEPVFADVEERTFSIDPNSIEDLLKTSNNPEEFLLILPVHLLGYPCRMAEINEIAERYNLLVLEDASQAHGSLYHNKKVGSLSLLSTFSFYVAHNIQVGEMGAVLTDSNKMSKILRKIKVHGRICDCKICRRNEGLCPYLTGDKRLDNDTDPRFTHDLIGYNFKTTEIQAALATVQLEDIESNLQKRRENVKFLNEQLNNYQDIISLPLYSENISYLAYPIVLKPKCKFSRRELRLKLENNGIETRPLFGCIPLHQPAYEKYKDFYKNKLPHADYLAQNGFYIGCHQYLTEEDLDYIVKVFKLILG